MFVSLLLSMTTIADLNDKWAAYAGPGGWNGKNLIFEKQRGKYKKSSYTDSLIEMSLPK